MNLARAMGAANIQFGVVDEDDLVEALGSKGAANFLIQSPSVLIAAEKRALEQFQSGGGQVTWWDNAGSLDALQQSIKNPSVIVQGPPAVRVVVSDQPGKTIVHLLNLDVTRISSFEDRVKPAEHVNLEVRVPFAAARSVKAISADPQGTRGAIPFTFQPQAAGSVVKLQVPVIYLSTILLIE